MQRLIIFCLLFIIITFSLVNSSVAIVEETTKIIDYYFITTCSTCHELTFLLDEIDQKTEYKINRINISNDDNYKKFNEELLQLNVPDNRRGIIPTIIYKDRYFIGKDEVETVLSQILKASLYN